MASLSLFDGKAVTVKREHDPSVEGLRYGCAYVYRVKGALYGWGDYTHCPAEDIDHNLVVLAARLRADLSLGWVGKAYDGDTYQSSNKRFGLAQVEAQDRYGETLRRLEGLEGGAS